jgi:hypothetical protein
MTTIVTNTVGPGKDYPNLAAWYAAKSGNLVTADEIRQAECYASVDTTVVTMTGSITDSTRYFKIYVTGSNRHAGVWDDSKYVLSTNTAFGATFNIQDNFVRIEGLQIYNSGALDNNSRVIEITSQASGSNIWIDGCIIRGSAAGTSTNASAGVRWVAGTGCSLQIRNTVVYNSGHGIIEAVGTSNIVSVLYNNTIAYNQLTGILFNNSNHVRTYINNISTNNTTAWDIAGTGNSTYTSNISDDATSPNVPLRNISVQFIDGANKNFHLSLSDTSAKGNGANLNADSIWPFTNDIDDQLRVIPWDIGADQTISSNTLVSPNVSGLIWPMRNRLIQTSTDGIIYPRPRVTNR